MKKTGCLNRTFTKRRIWVTAFTSASAVRFANLFDMDQKYADVVSIADAKDWIFSGAVGRAIG